MQAYFAFPIGKAKCAVSGISLLMGPNKEVHSGPVGRVLDLESKGC